MRTHRRSKLALGLLGFAFLVVVMTHSPQSARAGGVWYVTPGGSDADDCASAATACASINGALSKPGFVAGDAIDVVIGTYTGSGTEVVLLDKSATLSGGWDSSFSTQSGMSTIDGQNARRGITVSGPTTATVDHFTVQNGLDTGGFGTGGGGGIKNSGNLTVSNGIIQNNVSAYPTGSGGGWDPECYHRHLDPDQQHYQRQHWRVQRGRHL